MPQLKIFLQAIFIFTILASCNKETTQQPAAATCSSCDFYPVCTGPIYTYDVRLFDTLALVVVPVWKESYAGVEKDTTINGTVYQKMIKKYVNINGGTDHLSPLFYNCSNNITTTLSYQIEVVNGDNLYYLTLNTLKADAPLLATWSDIDVTPSGKKKETVYTIREKNISHAIYGITYNNVIHVSAIHKTNNETDWTGDYYWAKNIGLIEHAFVNGNSGVNQTHFRLINFIP
jgi:hypothetical protein